MRKFNAFTLAEVLITLGIIGVVAAMTMPTLMNQTNGAQYKAAYKKALSSIAQGITLNVALDGASFADTDATTTIENILSSRMNFVKAAAYNDKGYTISGDYKADHVCTDAETKASSGDCVGKTSGETVKSNVTTTINRGLFFNDGSVFYFNSGDTACTTNSNLGTVKRCYGLIDVNGAKGPNKIITSENNPTDVYPVEFYDQTIGPATDAARAVLYGK